MQIDGNALTEQQITTLIENKRVIRPKKDILEVLKTIKLYENIKSYKYNSDNSFLNAHFELMKGLIESAGKYRKQGVGIEKGIKVEHVAPPFENVPFLMKYFFEYLKVS